MSINCATTKQQEEEIKMPKSQFASPQGHIQNVI